MSCPRPRKLEVPEELREVLLDFAVSFLLEQPDDIPSYGVEFFTRLQETRRTTVERPCVCSETSMDDDDDESEKELEGGDEEPSTIITTSTSSTGGSKKESSMKS